MTKISTQLRDMGRAFTPMLLALYVIPFTMPGSVQGQSVDFWLQTQTGWTEKATSRTVKEIVVAMLEKTNLQPGDISGERLRRLKV